MEALGEKVRVECGCGAGLTAPVTMAGRSLACPKCQRMVEVPFPTEIDLGQEFPARGVLLALVAGLVCAGVWIVVALNLGKEVGLLGLGLGAACGVGMGFGTRRRDPGLAMLSGVMAVMLILLAKTAVMQIGGASGGGEPPLSADAKMFITSELFKERDNAASSPAERLGAAQRQMEQMTPLAGREYLREHGQEKLAAASGTEAFASKQIFAAIEWVWVICGFVAAWLGFVGFKPASQPTSAATDAT